MSKSGLTFTFRSAAPGKLLQKRGLEDNGRVQCIVDSEVMRRMEPYMPKLTGAMINSMITGTRIGSGEVVVNTPYAHARSKSARNVPLLRGPHFFERFKADCKDDILRAAALASGGKAEK